VVSLIIHQPKKQKETDNPFPCLVYLLTNVPWEIWIQYFSCHERLGSDHNFLWEIFVMDQIVHRRDNHQHPGIQFNILTPSIFLHNVFFRIRLLDKKFIFFQEIYFSTRQNLNASFKFPVFLTGFSRIEWKTHFQSKYHNPLRSLKWRKSLEIFWYLFKKFNKRKQYEFFKEWADLFYSSWKEKNELFYIWKTLYQSLWKSSEKKLFKFSCLLWATSLDVLI